MKLATVATTILFGADVALAARFTEQRRQRHAARAIGRGGGPMLPGTGIDGLNLTLASPEGQNDTNYHTAYSQNWAGAFLTGTGYKSVSGTFVIPTPKVPSGGSGSYAASAWVGIDGATATNSILQTGLDFYVDSTNGISYDAWYEWYPDYAYTFSGISFSAGDTVTLTATAVSTSSGIVVIKNVSKGTQVSHTFTSQKYTLSEYNAEWIVEDFNTGSGLVPFCNFGTVAFTSVTAANSGGQTNPVSGGATLLDIQQNGKILTSTSATSGGVTIQYIGN